MHHLLIGITVGRGKSYGGYPQYCFRDSREARRAALAVESISMLKEGDKAPEIKLQTDADEPFQLSKLKGQKVVLYFFPRADTPG